MRVIGRNARTGKEIRRDGSTASILDDVTQSIKGEVQGQYIAKMVRFLGGKSRDAATITTAAIQWFDAKWDSVTTRMEIVPGKSVLSLFRSAVAERYSVSMTDHRIVSEFTPAEIPADLSDLLSRLEAFSRTPVPPSSNGAIT